MHNREEIVAAYFQCKRVTRGPRMSSDVLVVVVNSIQSIAKIATVYALWRIAIRIYASTIFHNRPRCRLQATKILRTPASHIHLIFEMNVSPRKVRGDTTLSLLCRKEINENLQTTRRKQINRLGRGSSDIRKVLEEDKTNTFNDTRGNETEK